MCFLILQCESVQRCISHITPKKQSCSTVFVPAFLLLKTETRSPAGMGSNNLTCFRTGIFIFFLHRFTVLVITTLRFLPIFTNRNPEVPPEWVVNLNG
jgi:hypothetical protein